MSEEVLGDQNLGKLLSVISHYALENLEEVIDYDKKSEEEREDIVKAALKSLEVSSIITLKFLDNKSFNQSKLDEVHQLIEGKQFDKANGVINDHK